MIHFLALISGTAGVVLGAYILTARVDLLTLGVYRIDYIAFYVLLGGACMVGGVYAMATGELSYTFLAVVGATVAHISHQSRMGDPWKPPEHALTDHGDLDDLDDTLPTEGGWK